MNVINTNVAQFGLKSNRYGMFVLTPNVGFRRVFKYFKRTLISGKGADIPNNIRKEVVLVEIFEIYSMDFEI